MAKQRPAVIQWLKEERVLFIYLPEGIQGEHPGSAGCLSPVILQGSRLFFFVFLYNPLELQTHRGLLLPSWPTPHAPGLWVLERREGTDLFRGSHTPSFKEVSQQAACIAWQILLEKLSLMTPSRCREFLDEFEAGQRHAQLQLSHYREGVSGGERPVVLFSVLH